MNQRSGKASRRFYLRLLVILWAGFLPTACSDHPTLKPLAEDAVILAFGDSLTYGTGVSGEHSYPSVLAQLTNRQVLNFGVPGEVSSIGKQRLANLLEEQVPDLLILCHGGNDLIRKLDKQQLKENLAEMIVDAKEKGVAIFLVGVPNPTFILSTDEIYAELAETYKLVYEPDIFAEVLSNRALKSDTTHPNAQGYKEVATALHKRLQRAGAL